MPPENRELRKQFRVAVALAHGIGNGLGASDLMRIVLERGLPSREEREKILAKRLEEEPGDNEATESAPG